MPLPTLPVDATSVPPAIWGLIGVLVTKGIDYLANRSRNQSDENLRHDARRALLDERADKARLIREIRTLGNDLRRATNELHSARQETLQAQKVNTALAGKIDRLEFALEAHGIVIDHSDIEADDA